MSYFVYLIALQTIVIREVLRFSRIWIQTVLPAAITMSLYFVIFGQLIGSQIGDIHGVSYMDYIVPGLIMMAVINNAYSNVVASFYSAKLQRYIEEMLIAPIPNVIILLGFIIGGVMRGIIVGLVVTVVAFFFTTLHIQHIGVMLGVTLLTAILFSIGGLINGIYAKSFDDVALIPTFVLTPLTYLGGIFYSTDMLPAFWQTVSHLNPILYMVNAFRYSLLGISDVNLIFAFGMMLFCVVVLFIISLQLLNRGVGIRQ